MTIEKKSRYSPILILLLLCLSLFILTVPRAADASDIGNARVIDEADLLTDDLLEVAHHLRIGIGTNDRSDDVVGRAKTYEAIVKGETMPEPGLPESFNVLMHELKGLGLDIRLEE